MTDETNQMEELDLDNLDILVETESEIDTEQQEDKETEEKPELTAKAPVEEGEDDADEGDEALENRKSRASKRIKQLLAERKALMAENQERAMEAQRLANELKTFKKATVTSHKEIAKDAILTAKQQLKAALDSDDNDAVVEAQAALNAAQLRQTALENIDESAFEVEEQTRETPRNSTADAPEAMQDWLEENPWFQTPRNEKDGVKIQAAVAIYNTLVTDGYDPEDADFYAELNDKLEIISGRVDRTKKNDVKSTSDNDEDSSDAQTVKREKRKVSQTVQGASRTPNQTNSQTSKNKVTLTKEQQALADSLGVSHKDYARQLLKIEQASKRGDRMVELF